MSEVAWSPVLHDVMKSYKRSSNKESQMNLLQLLPQEKRAFEDVMKDKAYGQHAASQDFWA
ncbi:hypothetical protein [Cohnella soli]|uniref:Uncharacterized protein n=1 Tax=Cohnella soli TaxID=425005 RepID=A0ABW0HYK2_9BACL